MLIFYLGTPLSVLNLDEIGFCQQHFKTYVIKF
jgi:hypothetical protein